MHSSQDRLSAWRSIALVLLATGLALAGWAFLRADFGRGGLHGQVVDNRGQPAVGVNVQVEELRAASLTDRRGAFFLGDLPPGEYWLKIGSEAGSGLRLQVRVFRFWSTDLGRLMLPPSGEGN